LSSNRMLVVFTSLWIMGWCAGNAALVPHQCISQDVAPTAMVVCWCCTSAPEVSHGQCNPTARSSPIFHHNTQSVTQGGDVGDWITS
jgi:hypothetical protein